MDKITGKTAKQAAPGGEKAAQGKPKAKFQKPSLGRGTSDGRLAQCKKK